MLLNAWNIGHKEKKMLFYSFVYPSDGDRRISSDKKWSGDISLIHDTKLLIFFLGN